MTSVLTATPGQTVGPFFGNALPYPGGAELVPPQAAGAIRLHGIVFDGAGDPVPDALIEIWQADARGRVPSSSGSLHRDGWTFTGWGRAGTDDEGHYAFTTIEPGAPQAGTAAFFVVAIFARGLLNRLFTRAYVPSQWLARDPLLAAVPPERRETLVATREDGALRFDIRLQATPAGAPETVFLRYPSHRS